MKFDFCAFFISPFNIGFSWLGMIVLQVKNKVEEFREHMPLVNTLFNPGLRDRHWELISEVCAFPLKPDDSYSLSKFVDMNLDAHIPRFDQISEAASKEFSLEKAMEKMKVEWAEVSVLLKRGIGDNADIFLRFEEMAGKCCIDVALRHSHYVIPSVFKNVIIVCPCQQYTFYLRAPISTF